MSIKAVWWTLLTAMALAAILLFNYWASYQPLSTLAYSGIVMALCGLANLALSWNPKASYRSSCSRWGCSPCPYGSALASPDDPCGAT